MTMKITKTNRKIKQDYFDWLYQKIEERESSGLEDFISDLHSCAFVCLIPNDDNRAEDGLQLRNRFADELNFDLADDVLSGPCTVLEMLIALANRMDFILFDHNKGNRTTMWFWLFIDNLKLKKYNSNDEDAIRKKQLNKIIIKKFVRRDYHQTGKGGLFPINSPASDQRNVEIWYQMMDYISENYDI
jgi:hypothetical protein